jgi:hypothetical protein
VELEASGGGCLSFMCLLFHYRCKGSSDGVLERLFTPSIRTFQGTLGILVKSLARQELPCRLKLKAKRTKEKFYFVGEHQGEIFGSHLELRVAWED